MLDPRRKIRKHVTRDSADTLDRMDVVSDAISAVQLGRPLAERVRVGGSWRVRLDPYDGAGFGIVLKGACWLLTDSGVPAALTAGDAALLPHGTGLVVAGSPLDAAAARTATPYERWRRETDRRAWSGPDDTELLCGKYRLDSSRMHPLMTELPEVVHLPRRVGGHPELRAAIDLLAGELDTTRSGSCIALPSLIDLLLVYMLRSWMSESTCGTWPGALGDPVTAAALRAVHGDPAGRWTLDRLAAEAGVSRATLTRRFVSRVGRPPMAYLTWWRVTVAATLLRDTRETLTAIAGRCGYGSPYALSHAFVREFGVTPGRYRAQAVERTASAGGPGEGTPAVPRAGA